MPDGGPYSLLTLSFAVFSFVAWQLHSGNPAWQLRRRGSSAELGFCSAFLMLLVAARLAVGQVAHLVSMSSEPPDLVLASFDMLLISLFFALLTWTAVRVLTFVATADPIPK